MSDNEIKYALGNYQRTRRIMIAVLVVFLFVVLLVGQSYFPPDTPVHELLETFGVVLIFLGIIGRLWATLYIGGRKSAEVVSGGPYSITRNPLYLFSSIAACGVGAQLGSITATIGFGVICAAAFYIVILREEKFLKEALGAPYLAYMARVPRFFPKLSLYEEGDTGSFKPRVLLITLMDGLVFLVALPAFELVDGAQQAGILPVLFRFP
ncbi:isoprenylcysteine carboxylmethyltransferase family protein [Mesorhizobium sp. PAMC28654]|uniref:methyltransferase family protein n=1 Tax=Mesorhizobium sp. PAMC28654 TaxID=2880934 RepID=UPI001D0BCC00|nr:isoprenylcysteine carboxylmethyltransferase family protein [Mesorhizobium sp. PAMC28654]UDL86887.1 isoprenylcysteine carboxylmethyltransferase family protein [Mesorhizobium sp. PAMC28654]